MKKMIVPFVVLATLGMLAPMVHASSLTIDPFTQPPAGQTVSVTGIGTASNTATGLVGVVGGARTMQLNVTTSAFGQSSSLDVDILGAGTLSLNNGSGQDGEGWVTWNANGAGLGGVDLTNGGILAYLQATVVASDLNAGFRVDITETVAAGGSTAYWSANLGPGVSYVNQLLASFTNAVNVDFTQVNSIKLTLSGPNAQDTTLDLLEVTNTPIPEPITMSILGVGGLGLLIRRKRAM